ncbi:MAG TPA: hypothetical protein VFL36_05300 [Myxococcales bacterium]|nr:hypothetical protein [Myxococcales bacterium]
MAEFLLALAEFDEQRGWLGLGYSRVFQRSKRDAMALAAALQPSAAPHRDVITAAGPVATALRGRPRHNDLAARRAFGDEWMNRFTGDPARPKRRLGS